MKSLVNRLQANPRYARAFEWAKLISITGSAQILVQVLGLISGILIIRLLPTGEYALYTLANTMLGTIMVLADGGIGSGVLAQGGKVWKDPVQLGRVVSTGIHLRMRFAIGSLAVSLPVLFYLLYTHGATWLTAVLISLSLIPAFYAALSDTLLEVPVKLNQDIVSLQKNQIAVNIARFLMLAGSLFILPFTYIAILANGLPRIWANIKLKKAAENFADLTAKPDAEVKRQVLVVVKRTLPTAIYFCVSSQITIWLISYFGNTNSIADVGALGRLTSVLTLFTVIFSTLVIPRFARLIENPKILISKFIQIMIVLFLLVVGICGAVFLFPHQVLFILGKKYVDLTEEVFLMTIAGCIGMMGGIIYSLCNSRSWIMPPVLHISVSVISQALLIYFMDLSQTRNVLLFSIINGVIGLIVLWTYIMYRMTIIKELKE